MFLHDAQHTGRSLFVGPINGSQAQIFLGNETIDDIFGSLVIGSDGTLYFGAKMKSKSGIYAFSPNSTQKWFCETASAGLKSPALLESAHTVYTFSNWELLAVNTENGGTNWNKSFAYIYDNLVVGDDELLYFTALRQLPDSSFRNYLIGLNQNGEDALAFDIAAAGSERASCPAIDKQGIIYFGFNDTLFAIYPNGTERWRKTFNVTRTLSLNVQTPSIGCDGTIYVPVEGAREDPRARGNTGSLYGVNPDGTVKWERGVGYGIGIPLIGPDGSLYVNYITYPVDAPIHHVSALDPDGYGKWSLSSYDWMIPRAVDAEGTIYITEERVLKAINPDGSEKWRWVASDDLGWLSIGANGTLYIPSRSKLYAIRDLLPPDFSITAFPTSLTIQQGNSDTSVITIASIGGFSQPVQLSVSGAPSGVTASLTPEQVTPPPDGSITSTLTVSVDAAATPGNYNLTVIGTNGTITHTVDVNLQITVLDQPPQPTNLSPQDGATWVSVEPQFCSSPPLQDVDEESIPWEEINGGEVTRVHCQWQITTTLGDYSDPVHNETILYLIGRRDFPELPEKVCTYVDVLDYGTTYYWRVRHKDFRDVWSPWSEETSFTTKIKIIVEKRGLFGLHVGLTNEGFEDYVVTFEILDGTDEILDMRHNVEIYPPRFRISDNSFELPHRTISLWIIFDPTEIGELELLKSATLKFTFTYLTEEVTLESYVGHYFLDYENIISTDFDMTKDTYSFSNLEWSGKAKCYGMAATSILYFEEKLGIPSNKESTYELTMNEAKDNIDYYQGWRHIDLNTFIDAYNQAFGKNILEADRYVELKESLARAEPMIFFLSGIEGDHAIIVYKIVEFENEAHLLVYDNNYKYLSDDPFLVFQTIVYNLESRGLSYTGYDKFALVEAPRPRWLLPLFICSAGELRVYDSQGRVTGVINGEVKQEIPLSIYDEGNETVIILNPSDTFYYKVVGFEEGTYGLEIASIEYVNITTFTAVNISMIPNSTHQYAIDWDTLSQGDDGVTVEIDVDGDGVFEHQFLSDSNLTGGELEQAISHDISVNAMGPVKNVVGEGYSLLINLTLKNQGCHTETFNLTIYANTTIIHTFRNITLSTGNSMTVTFTWNTIGFNRGNYAITANATILPGETDTADNTFVDGIITVTIPGDVNGDRDVDIYDIVMMVGCYGAEIGDPEYIPHCDIDGNGAIDIYDIVAAAGNYGESW